MLIFCTKIATLLGKNIEKKRKDSWIKIALIKFGLLLLLLLLVNKGDAYTHIMLQFHIKRIKKEAQTRNAVTS